MKRRTICWLAGFALLVPAGTAAAQTESRPRTGGMTAAPGTGTAKPAARTASIPPSPPARPIVVYTTGLPAANFPGQPLPTSGVQSIGLAGLQASLNAPPPVAQVTYYPTIVLTDGRVLANFGTGRGYEQVLRKCPAALPYGAQMAPCWAIDAYGNYRVVQQR